jgi:hypothetical protein
MVLGSITGDSSWIADCGDTAVPILKDLIGHDTYGVAVAARIYLLIADEQRSNGTPSSIKLSSSAVAVRNELSDALWAFAFEGKAPPDINPRQLHQVQYWAIRSREDFDDNAHGSATDKKHLEELEVALLNAQQTGDVEFLSSVLTSLATYDPTDSPNAALVSNLRNILNDDKYASEHLLAGYALQQISGQKTDLTQYLR